jgi:hypothetical protein
VTWTERKIDAVSHVAVDEVVGGAEVEAMTVDDDGELHGVLRAETHQSMQRHHWFIRIGRRSGVGVLCILIVVDLDVEEALAAVAANVLFIVVVAEPCL